MGSGPCHRRCGLTVQVGPALLSIGSGNDSVGIGARANDTFGLAIGTAAVATGVCSVAVGAFAGDTLPLALRRVDL
jgi:hypothetical protein